MRFKIFGVTLGTLILIVLVIIATRLWGASVPVVKDIGS